MTDQLLRDSGLTHSQRHIWLGQRLSPASPLYNMAFALVFGAALRPDLFQRAWHRVVDDSDVLRTSVEQGEGIGVRRVRETSGPATAILDFRRRPDAARAFHEWCRERCSRPLAVDGALVDSVLVQLDDGRSGWYLNQHHLITDASSTRLLYRQVAAEYTALRDGSEAPPSLPAYYPTAMGLTTAVEVRGAARRHWDARQRTPARDTPFYGRRGRPVGTASTRLTLVLDATRSRAIDQLCTEVGFLSLSGPMSRFALFATLLVSWRHRISGDAEQGFDAPVAGRPTADARRSLGVFIEMFPFVALVEPRDTFRMLGAKCLEEAAYFLRHALPGTSTPSARSGSTVVLNYVPDAFGDFAGIPVDVEWVHPGHGDRVHALRLQIHDFTGSGRYTLQFDFNDAVLPDGLRHRSLEHFERLLAALLDDPDQMIASVDVQTDDERRALAVLNLRRSTPLPDRSAIAMVQAQAEATPERVALRQGPRTLSFGRLREDIEALASALAQTGVEPGDRVAIVSPRSIGAVVAVLASLRAGAAYVPIDPGDPPARIRDILRDSGARVLLSGEHQTSGPPVPGLSVLPIDDGIQTGHGTTLNRPVPGLDDLAYLMYTSGSTGHPKGVLIEHGGLADYLAWASRQYVRGDRLCFALFTSLSFDLTVTSVFLPLITGGTLEIYPEPEGPVDSALMDVVNANAVDVIKLTPSHLSLLDQIDLSGSRLRRVVVGGEDFKTRLAASVSAQFGNRIEIYNEYGPTEAVVGCVMHRYDAERDTATRVPIGGPADHVEVHVMNDAGVPVPEGVPGELWISRFGLARGYHRLEEPAANRFTLLPTHPTTRCYRTGDLVRFTEPGTLEYLGRLDRQLKIAGVRVEPAEVEAVLASLPQVERCAVVLRRQSVRVSRPTDPARPCIRCGLSSNYPSVHFDDEGVCSVCHSYEAVKGNAERYFKSMDDLRRLFETSSRARPSGYDCMMLLSGGKDSTYALCRMVEMGVSVYAVTLDNGFISEHAKQNMRRVTQQLGVPLEVVTTPAMHAIFRESLKRFSNVCHGCFKTMYTLSTTRARALQIPIIVTGLSRGQLFETRLTEEMFRDDRFSPEEVDAAVLEARKVYHRVDDQVARSLDVRIFQDDRVFTEIQFVDFYRYCDVGLDEVLSYLDRRVPWVRPVDTGRSTNCLINDAGIYVHTTERGYHNYALPYSWDVRLGQKTRSAALEELDDELDMGRVRRALAEVGYDDPGPSGHNDQPVLAAFYVASEEISDEEFRRRLGERLPATLEVRPETPFLTRPDEQFVGSGSDRHR